MGEGNLAIWTDCATIVGEFLIFNGYSSSRGIFAGRSKEVFDAKTFMAFAGVAHRAQRKPVRPTCLYRHLPARRVRRAPGQGDGSDRRRSSRPARRDRAAR